MCFHLPSLESFILSDLLSLSTTLVWNLFRDDVETDFGGEDEVDLVGDWRLDWELEFLEEFLEYRADIAVDRWGLPTMKSLPGEVERLGPSDLEHSDTFLLRQDCELEHSELLLDLPDPLLDL